MSTELAYQTDPFCWEFDAQIVGRIILPDGRGGVIFPKTFFFPTGGGQEHDTGALGDARVTDVLIDDDGTVVHVVDRAINEKTVRARVDGARRFAFMQHHSGQHLLSQAIAAALNLETVSANINIDSPSTIDLETPIDAELTSAENLANAIIYEDRAIKSYFITDEQVRTIPFRRPPKVTGKIRVIEIEGFDYSACGGTHCTRTGMIGVVKILKTERRAEKLRVYFICGERAFRYFQNYHGIVSAIARRFDTNPEGIVEAVEKQGESLRVAQKELQSLQPLKLQIEARELVARAEPFDSFKITTASFRNRSPQELRALASQLQNEPGVIALLASYDGAKVSLTVACAEDTRVSANELIRKLLAEIGGRGGGDAKLAQGGGAASEEWFSTLAERVRGIVSASR